MTPPDLTRLSHEEKDALILALFAQLADPPRRDPGSPVRRTLRLLRRPRPRPGLEPGSPFGQSLAAMAVYLHYAHAIGIERLAMPMDELFGLSIGEGAIGNILARSREPLLAAAAAYPARGVGLRHAGSQKGHAVEWRFSER